MIYINELTKKNCSLIGVLGIHDESYWGNHRKREETIDLNEFTKKKIEDSDFRNSHIDLIYDR